MGKSFASFDGTKIFYETMGDNYKRKPLIFLHGLGGDLSSWAPEREKLWSLGLPSIAVDLRGHGMSDRPEKSENYSLINFADDINKLIEKEGLIKPIIVGHCFGGMISLILAGRYLDKIGGLILVDTTYKTPLIGKNFFIHKPIHLMLRLIEKIAPGLHIKGYIDIKRFKNTPDYDIVRIVSDIARVSLRSYLMMFNHFVNYDASLWLKKINVPTLVIVGEKDSIFPPDMALALHKRIIKSKYRLIKKANHILVINNPHDLVEAIYDFVSEI